MLEYYNEVLLQLYKEQKNDSFWEIKELKTKILQLKEQYLEQDFQDIDREGYNDRFTLYDIMRQRKINKEMAIDKIITAEN